MREMIEIRPGHWIKVTRRIKRAAGVSPEVDFGKYIHGSEANLHKHAHKKYDPLMLDQADRLAHLVGLRAAAKAMNISYGSLQQWRYLKQISARGGNPSTRKSSQRYTLAQKQACVRIALGLMRRDDSVEHHYNETATKGERTITRKRWNIQTAFKEAGRQLGVNGMSIQFQYQAGMIPLPQQSTPETGSPPGELMSAAKPTGQ